VGVISMVTSHPQSEHLPLTAIVDFSGLSSNSFFKVSTRIIFFSSCNSYPSAKPGHGFAPHLYLFNSANTMPQ
jgi:hypothetical protein